MLGAIIADGWYAGFVGFDAKRAGAHYGKAPQLLAQLVITFADGSRQWIVTDESWQSATGAIRHADLLMGEHHDLRLEPAGWDAPGFDAADWHGVRCRDRGTVPLVADPGPPVRVTEEIRPVSITRDPQGRQVVDFGQNLTGWLRIKVDGPRRHVGPGPARRGARRDGSLYTENLRTARQTDESSPAVVRRSLEPRFTLHGFRYAEISGYPGDLDPADVVARVVHSDIERGRLVQLLRRVAGPAVRQHRLGSARQLHQRPDRLPAARRAARLARRRPDLRPHRLLQPRRRARSSPSGWTTWPTPSCPPGPSPTSRPGSTSTGRPRRPGATPG